VRYFIIVLLEMYTAKSGDERTLKIGQQMTKTFETKI